MQQHCDRVRKSVTNNYSAYISTSLFKNVLILHRALHLPLLAPALSWPVRKDPSKQNVQCSCRNPVSNEPNCGPLSQPQSYMLSLDILGFDHSGS